MTADLVVDVRMHRHSGIGVYIRHVVGGVIRSRPQWRIVLLGPVEALEGEAWTAAPNVELRPCDGAIYTGREQLELGRWVSKGAVFWSPHFNVPLWPVGRLVATVHDVLHLADPDGHVPLLHKVAARAYLNRVRRGARAVMFDSRFTEREFERLVGRPMGAASVVPCGVDDAWLSSADHTRQAGRPPYFVFVGNVKRHKNLGRLLGAFRMVMDRLPHDLVIVGATDGLRTVDRDALVDAQALAPRVKLTGCITDAELRALVAGADALVLPSLYEGFGLPALEAMAAGCPVLAADIPALRELAGDAAMFRDPVDISSMADGLLAIGTSEPVRATLRARGRHRAAGYRWAASIERAVAVLAQAGADSRNGE